jgi:hypothetical protein
MEPGLRGTEWDPEDRGDLRQGQVEVVMKDDEGPLERLETQESAFELIAVGDRRRVVGDRGLVQVEQLDIDPMPSDSPRLIDAGTDEQPVEPRVEAIGIAKRGQIAPGADEGILNRVLRLFGVPKDEPGGGIQPGDRGACQLGEGVMIASPRSLHEVSLHHAPRRRRGHPTTLDEYGEAPSPVRSISLRLSPARYHRRPGAPLPDVADPTDQECARA